MRRFFFPRRPEGVNTKTAFGHWELNFIVGTSNTGVMHTSVERKSRFLCTAKSPAITAMNTLEAQHRMFAGLPARAVASVTADNGSEFADHYKLADTLGIPTRRRGLMTSPTANSMSSWQRSIAGSEKSWAG